jgi:hypothetical protein
MKKTVKETIKALKTIADQDSTIFVMWFEKDEFFNFDDGDDEDDETSNQSWLDALDQIEEAEEHAEQIIIEELYSALVTDSACVTPEL